jgi:hypothetical protein
MKTYKTKLWALVENSGDGAIALDAHKRPKIYRIRKTAQAYAYKDQKPIKVTLTISEGWDDAK